MLDGRGVRERGYESLVSPPEGEACLQISLTAGHTEEIVAMLLSTLQMSQE